MMSASDLNIQKETIKIYLCYYFKDWLLYKEIIYLILVRCSNELSSIPTSLFESSGLMNTAVFIMLLMAAHYCTHSNGYTELLWIYLWNVCYICSKNISCKHNSLWWIQWYFNNKRYCSYLTMQIFECKHRNRNKKCVWCEQRIIFCK